MLQDIINKIKSNIIFKETQRKGFCVEGIQYKDIVVGDCNIELSAEEKIIFLNFLDSEDNSIWHFDDYKDKSFAINYWTINFIANKNSLYGININFCEVKLFKV